MPFVEQSDKESPHAGPEPEDNDEERKSEEHLPSRYVGRQIIADGHVNDPAYDGAVKAPGTSDKGGENDLDGPGGIDEARGDISVVDDRQCSGKSTDRCRDNEGDPLIYESIVPEELDPGLVFLDRPYENAKRAIR